MTCGFYWLYFNPFLMEIHYRQSNSLDIIICIVYVRNGPALCDYYYYNGDFDQVYH